MDAQQEHKKTWFENWFDENYLLLYQNRDSKEAAEQISLLEKSLAGRAAAEKLNMRFQNMHVLDVGCGHGRHSALLSDAGFQVTGIDISKSLIEHGRRSWPHIKLLHGDVMEHRPEKPYELVVSLFTGFGYYQSDEENKAFLLKLFDITGEGGFFWLDFLNAKLVKKNIGQAASGGNSERIERAGKVFLIEKKIIDTEHGLRVQKKITVYNKKHQLKPKPSLKAARNLSPSSEKLWEAGLDTAVARYEESVRLYSVSQMKRLLSAARFKNISVFGNYKGDAYTEESPRAIFFCQKAWAKP